MKKKMNVRVLQVFHYELEIYVGIIFYEDDLMNYKEKFDNLSYSDSLCEPNK